MDNTPEEDDITIEEEIVPQSSFKGQKEGKLAKLQAELEKCQAERKEYLDGWQRARADFANLEKRSREEKSVIQDFVKISMIEEILPTLDSFNMAFKNKESWEKVDATWRSGIEYIYNQFMTALNNLGVQKIDAVNVPFDTNLHHSIENVITLDQKLDHQVAEIVTVGYKISDKVLRPASVKIYHYESNQ